MNFLFEFLNIHINHLIQLPMTLKWHRINMCNKFNSFGNCSTWFSTFLIMIAPFGLDY
jgi:hypothetical protein